MYSIGLYIYAFGAWIASFFNKKIGKLVRGQQQTADILRANIAPSDRVVWFHAASLGEFEQGRPIIERVRAKHPEFKILLTFFSPSGYEVRKNYNQADVVCYLPFDTPGNVRTFLRLAHPEVAVFIKYEFWYNYLSRLRRIGARTYSVSSIFRPGQVFFRKWGSARMLRQFDHFFVQNTQSRDLLATIGLRNVTITGDTRFDRVLDIRHAAKDLPVVEQFVKGGRNVFIAGSSWEADEAIYIPYFARHKDWRLIIAPHVIGGHHLQSIEKLLDAHGFTHLCYTECERNGGSCGAQLSTADALIVDCFGKLSSIYRYATVALVGGGFGAGIHNVPEAAVYGVPVVFGPNNRKFREAQALLRCGGSFEFSDAESFAQMMDKLLADRTFLAAAGQKAGTYIQSNAGAAEKVYRHIFERP